MQYFHGPVTNTLLGIVHLCDTVSRMRSPQTIKKLKKNNTTMVLQSSMSIIRLGTFALW